jgi:hypothetical protein
LKLKGDIAFETPMMLLMHQAHGQQVTVVALHAHINACSRGYAGGVASTLVVLEDHDPTKILQFRGQSGFFHVQFKVIINVTMLTSRDISG